MITLLVILYTIVFLTLLSTLHDTLTIPEKAAIAIWWPLILIVIGISWGYYKLTGKRVEF